MIPNGKLALVTYRFWWNREFIPSFRALVSLRVKLTFVFGGNKVNCTAVQEGYV